MKLGLGSAAAEGWKKDGIWLLIPLLAFLFAAHNGLLLTHDSFLYAEAAENIAAGKGLVLDKGPYVNSWGPLYPVLLSLGASAVFTFAWGMQLLALLTSLLLWMQIGRRQLREKAYPFFRVLLVPSTPLLMVHVFLWSEAVFILFLSLYLYLLQQYMQQERPTLLLLAALPGLLMFLQRNAALFLLAGILLALLYIIVTQRRKHLPWLAVHALLVLSGGVLWNVYSYLYLQQQEAVQEVAAAVTFLANLPLTLAELGATLLPFIALGLVVVGALFISVLLLVTGLNLLKEEDRHFLKVAYAGLLSYLLCWSIIVPKHLDDMGRLLTPVVPLFYLLLVYGLDKLPGKRNFSNLQQSVLLAVVAAYPLLRLLKNVLQWGGWG